MTKKLIIFKRVQTFQHTIRPTLFVLGRFTLPGLARTMRISFYSVLKKWQSRMSAPVGLIRLNFLTEKTAQLRILKIY